MKKLIALFILITTLSSCSDDDNIITTPFEGTWVVEDVIYGDNAKTTTNDTNNITFSSEFIFSRNKFIIQHHNEVLSQGTYSFENINDNELLNYLLTLHISNDNINWPFSVQKKSDTSITLFPLSDGQAIYRLEKTQ